MAQKHNSTYQIFHVETVWFDQRVVEIPGGHWTQTFMFLFPIFILVVILKFHCLRRGTKGDTAYSVNLKKEIEVKNSQD